jgi:hypothetical protein
MGVAMQHLLERFIQNRIDCRFGVDMALLPGGSHSRDRNPLALRHWLNSERSCCDSIQRLTLDRSGLVFALARSAKVRSLIAPVVRVLRSEQGVRAEFPIDQIIKGTFNLSDR